MTNPLRGEVEIQIANETFNCRLTIDSLVKIEEELDKGILEIATDISQAKVRLKTLLSVLRYALRGGGNDFDERKIKSLITEAGLIKTSTIVAQLIADSLNDPDPEEDTTTKKSEAEK